VIYPGSIERTAFAERGEEKGYGVLEVGPGGTGGVLKRWTFHQLPARPMVIEAIQADGADGPAIRRLLGDAIGRAGPDAVLQIRVSGVPRPDGLAALRVASVRGLAPASMNVEVVGEFTRVRPS
jgi:hypothetical protein